MKKECSRIRPTSDGLGHSMCENTRRALYSSFCASMSAIIYRRWNNRLFSLCTVLNWWSCFDYNSLDRLWKQVDRTDVPLQMPIHSHYSDRAIKLMMRECYKGLFSISLSYHSFARSVYFYALSATFRNGNRLAVLWMPREIRLLHVQTSTRV